MWLVLCFGLALHAFGAQSVDAVAAPGSSGANAYGDLPLIFEPNHGQAARESAFVARGPGYDLHLIPGGLVASLQKQSGTAGATAVRVRFVDASLAAPITGGAERASKSNYLIGNDPLAWRTDVPNFERVTYRQIYPGIDLVFYGNQRRLEYDFIVAPGVSPSQIALAFEELDHDGRAPALTIDAAGRLVLQLDDGTLAFEAPLTYQVIDGVRQIVPARYRIDRASAGPQVAFEVGAYDTTKLLVIQQNIAITDLNITVDVQSGRSVLLIDQPCIPASNFGCGGDNIFVQLDDEAATSLENVCNTEPAIEGDFKPNSPLSAFDGDTSSGTWRLNIADNAAGDTGALSIWCLGVNRSVFGDGAARMSRM